MNWQVPEGGCIASLAVLTMLIMGILTIIGAITVVVWLCRQF